MLFEAQLRDQNYQIIVNKTASTWEVALKNKENNKEEKFSIPHKDFAEADGVISFLFQNHSYLVDAVDNGTNYEVYTRGSFRSVKIFNDEMLLHESLKSGKAMSGDTGLASGMPGKIIKVLVSEGDEVDEGTPLLIMEAMKMENEMKATGPAKVKKILVKPGDNVETGASLIQYE
jgi:biotin carboxyl carrier protein